jgi:lactoylglutathione lyase
MFICVDLWRQQKSIDTSQLAARLFIYSYLNCPIARSHMKFGYTIVYVPNVVESLTFFERAFGLSRRYLHESNTYGELETGETALAFAEDTPGESYFDGGHIAAHSAAKPLGISISLVTDDVPTAHQRALAEGAKELSPPADKPWGQTVSYVHCPDGTLVELCTPIVG